jgi:hypothetical protein
LNIFGGNMMTAFNREISQLELLRRGADEYFKQSAMSEQGLAFDDHALKVAAQLYFSLNRAYKVWRVEDLHSTQPPKIAGLTVAAILLTRPIYGLEKNESLPLFYANPAFGLQVGLQILGSLPKNIKDDTGHKLFNWLDRLRVAGAASAIDIISTSIRSGEFISFEDAPVKLKADEIAQLDMLVAIFELIDTREYLVVPAI